MKPAAILAFALGLALPSTATREWTGPLDLVAVAFLGSLFLRGRLRSVPDLGIVFFASIVLALIPAFMIAGLPASDVGLRFATMVAAYGLYLAGLNVARSSELLTASLLGLAVGVTVESVIFAGTRFGNPDFANPRMATFGFIAAALLIALGSTVNAPRLRRAWIAVGLVAASWAILNPGPPARSPDFAGWFPFGTGLGRSDALAGELGILGVAAFGGMVALPPVLCRRDHALRLALALVAIASIAMLQAAPLYRDRSYLFFLGAAAAVVLRRRILFRSRPEISPYARENPSLIRGVDLEGAPPPGPERPAGQFGSSACCSTTELARGAFQPRGWGMRYTHERA